MEAEVNSTQSNALAVSVPRAAALSGISRSRLYQFMGDGNLSYLKIGSRRLILEADLRHFLERYRISESIQTPRTH